VIVLFFIAVFFCVYTYAIFPLILHLRAKDKPLESRVALSEQPLVSVVIAAHNEANNIARKLESLRALDYPAQRIEFVFVSDGSTDQSIAMLEAAQKEMPNLKVTHYDPAAGKPTALNVGVDMASGDVLVFMDARQRVSANAIGVLCERLAMPGIGAVSGELSLADDNGVESANVGLYWRYEKWIRQNESRLFSTTGATGALYAIRRSDYIQHEPDVLLDDFDTPVAILAKGQRTVFEPDAKVFDVAESSASGEFRRKTRTLAGNFQSFMRNKWLFNPAKNPVFLQFLSHKVFRLLVPYAMLLALIASIFGSGWFLNIMLFGQIIFYAVGLANMMGIKALDNKVFNFIKVFLQLNAAAVAGAFRYLSGNASVRWKQS